MSELNLNLNQVLPPPKPPKQKLLIILLLLQFLILAALAVLFLRPPHPALSGKETALSEKQLLTLARRMEDLDLPGPAIDLWKQYMTRLRPDPEKQARLLYRMGVISQQGRLYEDAVSYYAQSEAVCKVSSLSPEISRRTQECLEQLGLFSARDRDLQRRTDLVSSPDSAGSPVLAEIGSWKITRKELERHVEQIFDQSVSGSGLSPEEVLKQKKSYMKMFSKGDNLLYYLQQFVFDQLLSREVREQKLREDEKVLQKCRAVEKQILDSIVLNKAIGQPTATDDEARKYYDSHQEEFKKDGKLQPFAEVSNSIVNQLTSQKRKEAHQKYFRKLADKYDVVFHTSLLPPTTEKQPSPKKDQSSSQTAPPPAPASQSQAIEL